MCPEMFKDGYSYEYDIWSLGIITYYLLFQRTPFAGENVKKTFENIKKGKFGYPTGAYHPKISDHAKDLFNRIFQLNPNERITLEEMEAHPFYTC